MPKIFYTERDIEDLYSRGITTIDINDGVVLTDLAREKMFKLGILPKRIEIEKQNIDVSQEIMVHKIKAAVMARIDENIDPGFLDAIIRKILKDYN